MNKPFQITALRPRNTGSVVSMCDGTQIYYRDWGEGPPVLFLAGWALPSDVWSYQMAPLSDRGLRCLAYDRRGHGRSSDPGGGFDYDTLADDLGEFLEILDLTDVTLVSHSMAGGEMVRYLTRCGPHRIARLVFVGATTPFLLKTGDNPDGVDGEMFEYFRREVLGRDYPGWLEDNARPFVVAETSEAMMRWVRSLMETCSMKALIECNRALTSTDFRAELAAIDLPALVLHGDADVSAPLDLTGRRTAAGLRDARLEIYEGGPHGMFLTHAERFNRDLLAFIAT
jgi:non-heme chloroperoxidase